MTAVARTPEKRVTWAELFFDLVFVVAVTRTSALVTTDHSGAGLLRALIVFVPVYWLWVGTSIQTNQADAQQPALRLRIFGVALAAVFMAVAMPASYDSLGLLFAGAYWAGRIVLGLQATVRMRTLATPWGVSIAVTGPLLVLGGLVHGTAREAIWGLAAALDLATPTLFQRRLRRMHIDADHLAERFGLFLLIALGESVVAVTTSTDPHHLTVAQAVAIAAAFALCAGLWWVYFHFAADAMRYALATAEVQLDITRFVLSFGHLAFIGSVIVVAVGLHETVHDPAHHLSLTVAALLYGGTATYLATFGFTRWAMFRQVSTTRLSAAAVVLVLLPAAPHLAGVISVLALAVVLTALNLAEYIQVQQRTSLVQAPA